jgi:hypothetical protein
VFPPIVRNPQPVERGVDSGFLRVHRKILRWGSGMRRSLAEDRLGDAP